MTSAADLRHCLAALSAVERGEVHPNLAPEHYHLAAVLGHVDILQRLYPTEGEVPPDVRYNILEDALGCKQYHVARAYLPTLEQCPAVLIAGQTRTYARAVFSVLQQLGRIPDPCPIPLPPLEPIQLPPELTQSN